MRLNKTNFNSSHKKRTKSPIQTFYLQKSEQKEPIIKIYIFKMNLTFDSKLIFYY